MADPYFGLPPKDAVAEPPKPCHTTPTFGCDKCIQRERDSWSKKTYDAWASSYKPPKCKLCEGPTKAFGYSLVTAGLFAEVGCITFNEEQGYCPCADADFMVKIA